MARYIGPKAKLSRREGTDLFLKSARRSISDKAKFDSKPGQHGRTSGARTSDFGLQLREKQKVKRMYGLLERQFRRYFSVAQKAKGVTGQMLLEMLERRLDNVLYRMGIATSRHEGRTMVRHRAVTVNGRLVDIPSYLVKVGDAIQVAPKRDGQAARMKENLKRTEERLASAWIQVDRDQLKGTILRVPQKDDIGLPIQEQLIV